MQDLASVNVLEDRNVSGLEESHDLHNRSSENADLVELDSQ